MQLITTQGLPRSLHVHGTPKINIILLLHDSAETIKNLHKILLNLVYTTFH